MMAKLKALWAKATLWVRNHGTKALGAVGGTIGSVSAAGVIPLKWLPWAMAVTGLCTFWRGFVNTKNLPTP